ncbi:MAG: LysM peptidoglycan-binding domain-containing protein [Caldilineaceae bacterium]|nr:LysM peptidoglycan-binding domain-containing protein [Caldilineaceae bacterium]
MKFPPAIYRLRPEHSQRVPKRRLWLLGLCTLACVWGGVTLALFSLSAPAAHAQTEAQPTEDERGNGYLYTVQRGDNWYSVAARTGTTVSELQRLNPQAVRGSGWLITGEKLFVPSTVPVSTETYTVQAGESWSVIAKKFGISIQLLKAANPQAIRANDVLRRNETLVIPLPPDAATSALTTTVTTTATATVTTSVAVSATAALTETTALTATTPTAEATALSTEEATPTLAPTATEEPTATPEPTATTEPTPEPTATATLTPTVESEPTASAAPAEDTAPTAQCPSDFADYPTAILLTLNAEGSLEALQSFLTTCNAATAGPLAAQEITGDEYNDLVLIYQNPMPDLPQPVMDLLILNGSADGFTIGYQARAESEVNLLGVLDLNGDSQSDVAWIETTCGVDSCFDTVQIYSWDGNGWRNWTAAKITMANAETRLEDQSEAGQGLEVVLSGGEYGNEAAGPQRSRTEIWGSVEGAPYALLTESYAQSSCLYHTVLDANQAFRQGGADDFEAAETLYTQALTDSNLVACGEREQAIGELQSFSLFRLGLIAAYRGQADVAQDLMASITDSYPDSIYASVGDSWLTAYSPAADLATACAAVTAYAERNPDATAVLADYGYANPSFGAAEICPVLDLEIPAVVVTTPAPDTAAVTDTAVITESASGPTLPSCPTDLAGYVDTLPTVLTTTVDRPTIDGWLRSCNAIVDAPEETEGEDTTEQRQRGTFRLADLNEDGRQDAIFLPTLVSDRGFGPDGTQGAVLIYHGAADGSYALVEHPEIYGLPSLLTVEDLNDDGQIDIAWSVEGCSTSCVREVQIVTWNGTAYVPIIEPGATIAEGSATFAAVAAGDPGRGQQLVLAGGVSNTPDGGLAVPHTEIWQSIDGGPFQRIRWDYDRSVEGSSCLGLRLVEADVALQASSVLGYAPAIELYTNSIDPSLQACSLFGLTAAEELPLLQGLASFRLVQAQALAGDLDAAKAILSSLSQGQPDSDYTKAAQQWLTAYEADSDAEAACAAIQPIFTENSALWQITDHYGYNHPALAAEQVCYMP